MSLPLDLSFSRVLATTVRTTTLSPTARSLTVSSAVLTGLALLYGNAIAQTAAPSPSQGVLRLEGISIFGAARDQRDLLQTPNGASVVGPREMRRQQASTYAELLDEYQGVTITGGPRGIAQEPNIRGFQDDQVVIRADGVRQNFNLAHRGRFFADPAILKQVEILRGGASTLYGSGALGGVIFLETLDAQDLVKPGDSWGNEVKLAGNGQGGSFLRSIALATEQGSVDALAFYAERPMYSDLRDGSDKPILDSRINSWSSLFKVGWEPDDANRFEISTMGYSDSGDTPNTAQDKSESGKLVDRNLNSQVTRLGWDYTSGTNQLVDLSLSAYLNDVSITERRYRDRRFDTTDFSTLGGEVTNISRFTMGVPVTLAYGVELFRDDQEATRNGQQRLQAPNAQRQFRAAFAQADFELRPGITLTPGLRYDSFDLNADSDRFADRSESQISPRLALNWQPDDNSQLFLSASQSFRAPTLTELYADGVHYSVPAMPLGDPRNPRTPMFTGINEFIPTPNLKPERATQVEIGGRYRRNNIGESGDSLQLSANVYYASVNDFVDNRVQFIDESTFRFNPRTRKAEMNGTTKNYNVDAVLYGFEGEISYDAQRWFTSANVTLPRGHQTRENGQLASIPQDRLVFIGGLRPTPGVEIGLRSTIAGEISKKDLPTDVDPTPSFVVFDLFANWQPGWEKLEGVSFSAGIDNLTNETYRIHGSGVNSAGRAVRAAANVVF